MYCKPFRVIQFLIVILASLFAFPAPSISQHVQVWSNLGLYGGQIYEISIDPGNPDRAFAGSYLGDGLFMTVDGGGLWQAAVAAEEIQGEDTFKNHAVWAVKIAPGNGNVVWAAHNLWAEKSTDGGQTWTHIYNSDMQRDCTGCGGAGDNLRFCLSLVIDPADHNTVYVGAAGPLNSYSSGAIY